MIAACDLHLGETVLEIGPGPGVLTRSIAPRVSAVIAVEKDRELAGELKQQFSDTNTTVIHADFLDYPFDKLPSTVKVIGNVPYHISTAILEKLIANRRHINYAFLTLQLEFAQRLAAASGRSKAYGSLSCYAQYYADVEILFRIPARAFRPAPKITSCFLKLSFREPAEQAIDEEDLFALIRLAFQQRRKKLFNTLASWVEKKSVIATLTSLDIDASSRPEDLSLKDYVAVTNALAGLKGKKTKGRD